VGEHETSRVRPWIIVIALVAVLGLQAASQSVSFLLWNEQSQAREQVWCPALRHLTARPIPRPVKPKINPSRENAYQFYLQFVAIRNGLGCL